MLAAVYRLDLHRLDFIPLEHIQRDHHTGVPAFPQPLVKIGLAAERLAAQADNDVPGLQTGIRRRALIRDAGNDHLSLHFL